MSAVLKVENLNVTLTYRKASKKLVEDVSILKSTQENAWGSLGSPEAEKA